MRTFLLSPFSRHARRAAAVVAVAATAAITPVAGNAADASRGTAGTSKPDTTNLVVPWFDLTNSAVAASGLTEQSTQNRVWAVSWLAAARAVGDVGTTTSRSAAFVTALHDTLVTLVPTKKPDLDAAESSTLDNLPAGGDRDRGTAAGSSEAQAVLTERAGDGLETVAEVNHAWSPPPASPGIWQPTPPSYGPAVRAGLPTAKAFLLAANNQFRAAPPPGLDTRRYLESLAEVHRLGSINSAARTPAQTDVANFIAAPSIAIFNQVLRAVLVDTKRPITWQTNLIAAFNTIQIDQQISIYDSKYTYVRWRPVTAIRVGNVDPDPNWTPLIATPSHPEYPSGHAGYAATAETVLSAFLGKGPVRPITVTSPTLPDKPRTYSRWSTLTQETLDGRVWEGVHFRFSDEVGAQIGRQVAVWDLRHLDRLGLD